ncbi:putative spermidine/putrescine transport system substrate-binding protein [Melghirimyces profundicolus]|uniref:Putative spermidine/putrescine transport system substrate-binding protein n=1 Tax=Melghirimyces profundicolus TaxID=1242148 RepID=A0A2T6C8U8_9BACL|nr:ABC transporter substrate-binding protein [Melghirimyces profundicolus]PTX64723.1 putative spermidine/putrescine transport system substrate-binding protein [Melghirimyces profundicolus]
MKKRMIPLLFTVLVLVLGGCMGPSEGTTFSRSLLKKPWEEVVKQAKGTDIRLYMWGGDESINRYIDEWAAPRLKKQYGVKLERVPVSDTQDIINKLLTEKQAGKNKGTVDLIWINGENFHTAKEQKLLWGAFADRIPNVKRYVNRETPDIRLDFGEETQGLEVPWGKAQFVFIYDRNKVKNPPKSMAELKEWVRNHPGKFTYPAPPDFTGSAFVRQALFETTGGHKQYVRGMEDERFNRKAEKLWAYLNDLEPYLWREGKTYPESLAKLDQLYANGEVWMTMGYDAARAAGEIRKGRFPESTRTFVLDQGTLSNTHYLSIPFNAPNPAGAMVATHFLLSPDAQLTKMDPDHWGEDMALDPERLSKEDQARLKNMDRGEAILPSDKLAKHRIPEVPASVVNQLEKGWKSHVAKK